MRGQTEGDGNLEEEQVQARRREGGGWPPTLYAEWMTQSCCFAGFHVIIF